MGNLIADMLLNMQPNDRVKMQSWLKENIVQVAIEELLKPENMQRLAIAIAMEMRTQSVETR